MENLKIANDYGNFDVRNVIPSGYQHVKGKQAVRLCRKMDIRFAPAMTGFVKKRRQYKPTMDGVVVSDRSAVKLLAALAGIAERAAKRGPVDPAKTRAARTRRQERETASFAEEIRSEFPGMPAADVLYCAKEATEIGSGRVGRSNTADDPVRLAVLAYARHTYTDYENSCGDMEEGDGTRKYFNAQAGKIIDDWRRGPTADKDEEEAAVIIAAGVEHGQIDPVEAVIQFGPDGFYDDWERLGTTAINEATTPLEALRLVDRRHQSV